MFRSLFAVAAIMAFSAGSAFADYTLTLLHTNDFHDRYEPISKSDGPCDAETNQAGECFGGSARLVTALAKARARSNNSILVDGGDQFQGTLFYTHYKGVMTAEFMNKLGYDVMTVGNHEFDDGPEVLKGFVEAVDFPVLMSNADISLEPILKDKIAKSTVIERGGEKIGLIGLTPVDTAELASPGKNITFSEPVQAVQGEVDRLTAEGVNKIIVLSHSGMVVDRLVAQGTKGVDVIVGGHDNTYLSNTDEKASGPYPVMVGTTAIVQAYAYGKFLGELNITFDDAGVIREAKGEPLIMNKAVAEDADTLARVAELAKPLEAIRARVVAEAAALIDGNRDICRQTECSMGNLVAEAQLDRVKDQGVTISLVNSGGLRASIEPGEVTMGEVLTVLPFQNTLSTFEVSGQMLKDALENGVSQYEEKAGRFLQVAGMKYSVDTSKPAGERITEVLVAEGAGFAALDVAKSYYAVANNYVRQGGDGFAMFERAAKAYDYGPDLAEVVANFLAKDGAFTPYTDGRITVK